MSPGLVSRRAYIDWLRGIAVLCMIEWHVLDAWTSVPARASALWPVAGWIGGWAAPLFLFLAGVAVPFAIAGHAARGATPGQAAWRVERRGWQVFWFAHLFRLQSFVYSLSAPFSSLLAPDILNILGLGLAVTARATGWARPRAFIGRVFWLVVPALAVIALTPFAAEWPWPSRLPAWLEAYIRPNGMGLFRIFPSLAFVPLGAFAGLLLSEAKDEGAERRALRGLAIAGALTAAAGFVLGRIDSPQLFKFTSAWSWPIWQTGVMTFGLWAAWELFRTWQSPAADRIWAPVLVLGRTSLFVYWVHVELAYGVLSYPLHHALPLPGAVLGVIGMIAAMYYAAGWWNRRVARPWIPGRLTVQ
ncbi:MAG TPA: heparan-alpha-glucosaminide N-acetyltransferase domain-containing protein [Vicinamibacterales bacterium]|nr:heparan-alpha-glucosaminide N-acetyltransferase domain-containing protein [Vicinamibacterales bacterium]